MKGQISVMGQPILLPMIKQFTPQLLAQQILGVQPMTGDVGKIFSIRANYKPEVKYKFSRAHWYVAEFDIKDYTDVVHWCREQFGPHPKYPDAWSRWENRYENRIHFRDEKDYQWFVLRWGA